MLCRLAGWARYFLPLFTEAAILCTVYIANSQIHGHRYTSLCGRCIRQRKCSLHGRKSQCCVYILIFVYLIIFAAVRLANSGFGHSGTPSPPFPPSFSPPLHPSLSPGPQPLNQLEGLGERCKLPQWAPADKGFGAYLSSVYILIFVYLITFAAVRLANSGFGHSGTPSPPFPPSFSPPLPPSLSPGPQPLNQLRGLGERCKLPQWAPADKWFGAYPSQKEQVWWQQFLCIFLRINLNFCTNTRLLSSRYSVSLRAKHSVGSRGKAPGQGVSWGTKSPWSWLCWWHFAI